MKRLASLCALVVLISSRPALVGAATINGQTTAPNSPLTSPVIGAGTATADVAQVASSNTALFGFAQVNTAFSAALTYQGFTAANNWVYSFNGLPAPLANPVGLGASANFNVTTYNLGLNVAQTGFGESMQFTLQNNTGSPNTTGLNGVTVTLHWLQLINESTKIAGNFGTMINGLQGWWALDNGFVLRNNANPTAAPYYDSNNGPAVFPPNFVDNPGFFGPLTTGTTYLHFITIPTWDVNYNGTDYIIVGNDAVEWGMTITPEPSTFAMGISLVVVIAVIVRKERFRACRAA
jgi:hypothetical protein